MLVAGLIVSFLMGGLAGGFVAYFWHGRKLHKKLNYQSFLIATAGHQLRAPLDEILTMAQRLEGHARHLPEKIQKAINTIIGSGSHLKLSLIDILDVVELETDQLALQPSTHAFKETIDIIEKVLQSRAEKKGVTLRLFADRSSDVWLNYDEVRVRQCIESIILQCINQSPRGTVTVNIGAAAKSKKSDIRVIEVTAHDGGPGMDQLMAESYFKPPHRKRDGRAANPSGVKMSLILSQVLARKMGGDLSVRSAFGSGVRFRLKIPAKLEARPRQAATKTKLSAIELARAAAAKKSIMIVDDNDVNVALLNSLLVRAGITNAMVARDEKEAMELVAQAPCDLILMDTNVQIADGKAANHNTQDSQHRWRDIPIIAIAGRAQSERYDANSCGAKAVLNKPVDAVELYRKLTHVLAA